MQKYFLVGLTLLLFLIPFVFFDFQNDVAIGFNLSFPHFPIRPHKQSQYISEAYKSVDGPRREIREGSNQEQKEEGLDVHW